MANPGNAEPNPAIVGVLGVALVELADYLSGGEPPRLRRHNMN